MKTREISKENERKIIDMYVDGFHIYEICRTVNVYRSSIERLLVYNHLLKPSECKYGGH